MKRILISLSLVAAIATAAPKQSMKGNYQSRGKAEENLISDSSLLISFHNITAPPVEEVLIKVSDKGNGEMTKPNKEKTRFTLSADKLKRLKKLLLHPSLVSLPEHSDNHEWDMGSYDFRLKIGGKLRTVTSIGTSAGKLPTILLDIMTLMRCYGEGKFESNPDCLVPLLTESTN